MLIRNATMAELDAIMQVYAAARQTMRGSGNPTQWQNNYPPEDIIVNDIQQGQCYVCVENAAICAVFMTAAHPDPCYAVIENGSWKNNAPYAVIHRVASNGTVKGVLAHCIAFCKRLASEQGLCNLRIDTHADNHAMQHLLAKNGFEACGIVYMRDHSPRLAYQLVFG